MARFGMVRGKKRTDQKPLPFGTQTDRDAGASITFECILANTI